MQNYHILLSGPSIFCDQELIDTIEEFAAVSTLSDNTQIHKLASNIFYDLILFEIGAGKSSDFDILKMLNTQFPDSIIIIVDGNGDSELLATAISFGVKDVFKKPYKYQLIAERVNALLKLK